MTNYTVVIQLLRFRVKPGMTVIDAGMTWDSVMADVIRYLIPGQARNDGN